MAQVSKPAFINPFGDPNLEALAVSPPFVFRNVTARIFPLRANVNVLGQFCDQYLNMDIPPTIVHYAPALPYVYLMILNYGSMAAASVQAQNVGWVAQREIAFTVPLQRWREENGELVFKDWSAVSPFIYVDDQLSLTTGREVYGWNKVTGSIDSDVPLWLDDPRAPLRQFDLSVVDFANTYAGVDAASQRLLEVDLDPPPTFTEFPPNPRNPWSPLWILPNATANAASLLGSALDTALALRIRGYEMNRSAVAMRAMAGALGQRLEALFPQMLSSKAHPAAPDRVQAAIAGLPDFFFDNVTLKQFRNPENPSLACYQALVNSKMGVDRLNRIGLLGDINLLRGDTSGGYGIRIHRMEAQPIIQTLGLEVFHNEAGEESRALLKPVLPLWMDVDLFYGKGEVICSRAHGSATDPAGAWTDEQAPPQTGLLHVGPPPPPPVYNTALGAATQPISGPFHFPDATLQIYPLLADRAKLGQFLENAFNGPLSEMYAPGTTERLARGWRFEPFGSYAYLIVTVYGEQLGESWSSSNNIGGFFDRKVSFAVPVKWFDEKGELVTVGLVEPFTYANSGRAVATDREVNGFNTVRATIESPADPWLSPSGPIARRKFLRLDTEVLPALNVGEKAVPRTLLEIEEFDPAGLKDMATWTQVAQTWTPALVDDLKRKSNIASTQPNLVVEGKALATELLAFGNAFNRFVVKQYRDGADVDAACYQALVHVQNTVTGIYDIREMTNEGIPASLHVRLHRCHGHLIADALGLVAKRQESSDGDVVDILQPLRPFWMRVGLKEELGLVACYRAKSGPWTIVHPWFAPESVAEPSNAALRKAGAAPYFRRAGETRAGPFLGDTDASLSIHDVGVRSVATAWLRRALTNELIWIRVCAERLSVDGGSGIRAVLARSAGTGSADQPAPRAAFFDALLATGSPSRYCDGFSIPDLEDYVRVLKAAMDATGKPLPDPLDAADLAKFEPSPATSAAIAALSDLATWIEGVYSRAIGASKGAAWVLASDGLTKILQVRGVLLLASDIALLPPVCREAFSLALTDTVRTRIVELASLEPTTFDDLDTQDKIDVDAELREKISSKLSGAAALVEALEETLSDWRGNRPDLRDTRRWWRLSVDQARDAIMALDEVQVVVDDILSNSWEDRSFLSDVWLETYRAPRPAELAPDGPDMSLPDRVGTVRAEELGLVRWKGGVDGGGKQADIWVVPGAPTTAIWNTGVSDRQPPPVPNPPLASAPADQLNEAQAAVVPAAPTAADAADGATAEASKDQAQPTSSSKPGP